MRQVPEVLDSINESLSEAEKALSRFERRQLDEDETRETEETISYYIERAFLQMLLLLDAKGLTDMHGRVAALQRKAEKNYPQASVTSWGDLFSLWARRLRLYIAAIESTYGGPIAGIVTKDLINILRATQYAITDKRVFLTRRKMRLTYMLE